MLNIEKDRINKLTGKADFNVGDLKRILNEIPDGTYVYFGNLTGNNISIGQDENLIFELKSIHEKDQGPDCIDSDLLILVNQNNESHTKR